MTPGIEKIIILGGENNRMYSTPYVMLQFLRNKEAKLLLFNYTFQIAI